MEMGLNLGLPDFKVHVLCWLPFSKDRPSSVWEETAVKFPMSLSSQEIHLHSNCSSFPRLSVFKGRAWALFNLTSLELSTLSDVEWEPKKFGFESQLHRDCWPWAICLTSMGSVTPSKKWASDGKISTLVSNKPSKCFIWKQRAWVWGIVAMDGQGSNLVLAPWDTWPCDFLWLSALQNGDKIPNPRYWQEDQK